MNPTHVSSDRTGPGPVFTADRPEPVRWWIPLVASTGALLVLVLGTAAIVSNIVTSTIGSLLG